MVVELGPGMKAEWVRWCSERQLVVGKAVRVLVERAMAEGLELATVGNCARVQVKVAPMPDEGLKVGREIYFTESENAAIHAVSQAQGFGFHEWVVAAVRGALANAPTYGQAEVEALTKSNIALVKIAADLAALRKTADVSQSIELQGLERVIKAHVQTASHTLAQGARRWQLKM